MVHYKNQLFAKFGHDCDVKTTKDDQLPMFKLGGNLLLQIKNMIVRSKMASEINPRGNRLLRSQKAVHEEQLKHLQYPLVVHPFSNLRKHWEIIMCVTFAVAFVAIPLDVASFGFPLKGNLNGRVRWKAFRFLLDAVCCLDVLLNFCTGYVDARNRAIVMDPRKIGLHYAFTHFVPDILSSVPAHPVLFTSDRTHAVVFWEGLFHYCSLLKVFRVYTFSRYCRQEFKITFVKCETALSMFCYALFFHGLACLNLLLIGFGNVRLHRVYTEVRPYEYYILWPQINSTRLVDFYEGYLMVLRESSYMATFAYLDESMTRSLPRWYIIAVLFMSKVMFFFLIGRLMQVVTISRSASRKYQEMLSELKEYMMHKQLPMSLQQRLLSYYEFRFQRSYFRETEILSTVSGQLKQDLVMHGCRRVVERVAFFKTMPMNLIVQIVSTLETEIYMVNDVIVKANTPGVCMYFIASGCVAAYTKYGIEFIHLGDGDYFGEYSLIHKCCAREWNVVAIETCELYRFDYDDFVRIIVPHPEFLQKITTHAQERYEMLDFHETRHR